MDIPSISSPGSVPSGDTTPGSASSDSGISGLFSVALADQNDANNDSTQPVSTLPPRTDGNHGNPAAADLTDATPSTSSGVLTKTVEKVQIGSDIFHIAFRDDGKCRLVCLDELQSKLLSKAKMKLIYDFCMADHIKKEQLSPVELTQLRNNGVFKTEGRLKKYAVRVENVHRIINMVSRRVGIDIDDVCYTEWKQYSLLKSNSRVQPINSTKSDISTKVDSLQPGLTYTSSTLAPGKTSSEFDPVDFLKRSPSSQNDKVLPSISVAEGLSCTGKSSSTTINNDPVVTAKDLHQNSEHEHQDKNMCSNKLNGLFSLTSVLSKNPSQTICTMAAASHPEMQSDSKSVIEKELNVNVLSHSNDKTSSVMASSTSEPAPTLQNIATKDKEIIKTIQPCTKETVMDIASSGEKVIENVPSDVNRTAQMSSNESKPSISISLACLGCDREDVPQSKNLALGSENVFSGDKIDSGTVDTRAVGHNPVEMDTLNGGGSTDIAFRSENANTQKVADLPVDTVVSSKDVLVDSNEQISGKCLSQDGTNTQLVSGPSLSSTPTGTQSIFVSVPGAHRQTVQQPLVERSVPVTVELSTSSAYPVEQTVPVSGVPSVRESMVIDSVVSAFSNSSIEQGSPSIDQCTPSIEQGMTVKSMQASKRPNVKQSIKVESIPICENSSVEQTMLAQFPVPLASVKQEPVSPPGSPVEQSMESAPPSCLAVNTRAFKWRGKILHAFNRDVGELISVAEFHQNLNSIISNRKLSITYDVMVKILDKRFLLSELDLTFEEIVFLENNDLHPVDLLRHRAMIPLTGLDYAFALTARKATSTQPEIDSTDTRKKVKKKKKRRAPTSSDTDESDTSPSSPPSPQQSSNLSRVQISGTQSKSTKETTDLKVPSSSVAVVSASSTAIVPSIDSNSICSEPMDIQVDGDPCLGRNHSVLGQFDSQFVNDSGIIGLENDPGSNSGLVCGEPVSMADLSKNSDVSFCAETPLQISGAMTTSVEEFDPNLFQWSTGNADMSAQEMQPMVNLGLAGDCQIPEQTLRYMQPSPSMGYSCEAPSSAVTVSQDAMSQVVNTRPNSCTCARTRLLEYQYRDRWLFRSKQWVKLQQRLKRCPRRIIPGTGLKYPKKTTRFFIMKSRYGVFTVKVTKYRKRLTYQEGTPIDKPVVEMDPPMETIQNDGYDFAMPQLMITDVHSLQTGDDPAAVYPQSYQPQMAVSYGGIQATSQPQMLYNPGGSSDGMPFMVYSEPMFFMNVPTGNQNINMVSPDGQNMVQQAESSNINMVYDMVEAPPESKAGKPPRKRGRPPKKKT